MRARSLGLRAFVDKIAAQSKQKNCKSAVFNGLFALAKETVFYSPAKEFALLL